MGFYNVWNDKPGQWVKCTHCGEEVCGLQGVIDHVCKGAPTAYRSDMLGVLEKSLAIEEAKQGLSEQIDKSTLLESANTPVVQWGEDIELTEVAKEKLRKQYEDYMRKVEVAKHIIAPSPIIHLGMSIEEQAAKHIMAPSPIKLELSDVNKALLEGCPKPTTIEWDIKPVIQIDEKDVEEGLSQFEKLWEKAIINVPQGIVDYAGGVGMRAAELLERKILEGDDPTPDIIVNPEV